jgi:hypothetical protein
MDKKEELRQWIAIADKDFASQIDELVKEHPHA